MRSRFLMMVFLIVLGVGLIGVLVSIANSVPQSQFPAQAQISEVSKPEASYVVWVAKHKIERGEAVSRQDFRLERLSESQAFEHGIQQDVKLDFVAGMVVSDPLDEGQPVLPEHIIRPSDAKYLHLVMDPGYVPSAVSVKRKSMEQEGITMGQLVDVMGLTSSTQNLAHDSVVRDLGNVSLVPILTSVKVLQVIDPNMQTKENIPPVTQPQDTDLTLVLQLTRKQQAKLTIAQSIAKIEIHLSTGETLLSELSADSGDIMPDYKSVRELRGASANSGSGSF